MLQCRTRYCSSCSIGSQEKPFDSRFMVTAVGVSPGIEGTMTSVGVGVDVGSGVGVGVLVGVRDGVGVQAAAVAVAAIAVWVARCSGDGPQATSRIRKGKNRGIFFMARIIIQSRTVNHPGDSSASPATISPASLFRASISPGSALLASQYWSSSSSGLKLLTV